MNPNQINQNVNDMKASELMIGDIIFHRHKDVILKVLGVYVKHRAVYANVEHLVHHQVSYDEEEVKPIPLTEEIMKAIATRVSKAVYDCETFYKFSEGFNCITVYGDARGFFVCINVREVRIKYLHELQHVLRLCGLTALAENFKNEDYAWLKGESN